MALGLLIVVLTGVARPVVRAGGGVSKFFAVSSAVVAGTDRVAVGLLASVNWAASSTRRCGRALCGNGVGGLSPRVASVFDLALFHRLWSCRKFCGDAIGFAPREGKQNSDSHHFINTNYLYVLMKRTMYGILCSRWSTLWGI